MRMKDLSRFSIPDSLIGIWEKEMSETLPHPRRGHQSRCSFWKECSRYCPYYIWQDLHRRISSRTNGSKENESFLPRPLQSNRRGKRLGLQHKVRRIRHSNSTRYRGPP